MGTIMVPAAWINLELIFTTETSRTDAESESFDNVMSPDWSASNSQGIGELVSGLQTRTLVSFSFTMLFPKSNLE